MRSILSSKKYCGYITKNSFLFKGLFVFVLIITLTNGLLIPKPVMACIGPIPCPADLLSGPLEGLSKGFFDAIIEYVSGFAFATVTTITSIFIAILAMGTTVMSFLAKQLMEIALELSLGMSYTSNAIFKAGWPVLRDLANMSLIVILVVIAVGTILNLKTNKRLLPVFILVALLVNFTPVFTGVIIDLSNITGQAFYTSAITGSDALINNNPARNLIKGMENIGKAWESAFKGDFEFEDMLAIILVSLFGWFNSLMLMLLFLLLSVLLLGRTMALILLVILSPIAFVSYILPNTKKIFNSWWHNFIQWSIIIIPFMFFLWLGSLFASGNVCQNVNLRGSVKDYGEGVNKSLKPLTEKTFVCEMFTTMMATGVLVIGIILSIKSSATGSKIITNKARDVAKWGKRRAGEETMKHGGAKATGATGRKIGQTLGRLPVVGGRFIDIGRNMERVESRQREKWKEYEKEFTGVSFSSKLNEMQNTGFGADIDKTVAAWESALKENPKEVFQARANGQLTDDHVARFLQIAQQRHGKDGKTASDAWLKRNPQDWTLLGRSSNDIQRQAGELSAKEITKLSPQALESEDVILGMINQNDEFKPRQLTNLIQQHDLLGAFAGTTGAILERNIRNVFAARYGLPTNSFIDHLATEALNDTDPRFKLFGRSMQTIGPIRRFLA